MTDDPLPPLLADAAAIGADIGIHPGTIRTWARQGKITTHRNSVGRTVYDYDQVASVADAAARRAATCGGWGATRGKIQTGS